MLQYKCRKPHDYLRSNNTTVVTNSLTSKLLDPNRYVLTVPCSSNQTHRHSMLTLYQFQHHQFHYHSQPITKPCIIVFASLLVSHLVTKHTIYITDVFSYYRTMFNLHAYQRSDGSLDVFVAILVDVPIRDQKHGIVVGPVQEMQ